MTKKEHAIRQAVELTTLIIFSVSFCIGAVYFGGVTQGGFFIIQLLTGCAALVWLFSLSFARRTVLRTSPLLYSMLPFVFISWGSQFYSLHPYESFNLFLMLSTYVLAFFVIINAISKEYGTRFLQVWVIAATGITIYGIIIFFLKEYDLFWYTKIYYKERLNATFVNPNHFACFLNLVIPCTAYLLLCSHQDVRKRIFYSSILILFLIALMLTFSYGGLIAFFIGLAYFVMIGTRMKMVKGNFIKMLSLTAVGIICVFILSGLFFKGTFSLYQQGFNGKLFSYASRLSIWKGCLLLIVENISVCPLRFFAGYGLGCFQYIYNLFHPSFAYAYFEHAHNDYLELLIELGMVGIAAFLYIIYHIYKMLKRGFLKRNKKEQLLNLCIGTSCLTFFVHSFVDFNFYITINAFFLVGLLAIINITEGRKKVVFKGKIAIGALFICVAAFLFFTSRIYIGAMFFVKAREKGHALDYKASRDYFEKALSFNKRNAEISREYGEMYFQWAKLAIDQQDTMRYSLYSEHYFNKAIKHNSHKAQYYARLAELKQFRGNYNTAERLYDRAVELMPRLLQPRLVRLAFYVIKDNPQYQKALHACQFLLENIQVFTFKDAGEKKRILNIMRWHLEAIPPSNLRSDIQKRISHELATADNESAFFSSH
ncbi:MAG: O-antigen ligase family protein [Candidatus Omnitrophica bacterium]|nr:O-antigen ligase family protein [Candidatus Omnitrophota bacterium]